MKKFKIEFSTTVYGTMEVEADDINEAIEKVENEKLSGYCGNGGTDKLVGVSDDRILLDIGDTFHVDDIDEIEEL